MTPTDIPLQTPTRVPLVRTAAAGGLMGAANLVPGVSGGTMVLVMGVYDRFIDAVAGVSRGKFTRERVIFLAVLVAAAAVVVLGLARVMTDLFTTRQALMKALFVGMTLAGTPPLWKMAKPRLPGAVPVLTALAVGFGVMLLLALTENAAAREEAQLLRSSEAFRPTVSYARDAGGGLLAMAAMVLPGISGAYMLLLLGRYEHITGAISLLRSGVTGDTDDLTLALSILVPVGVAALLGLVLLSNLLKGLLERHTRVMGGLLLGVLWGSVFAINPLAGVTTTGEAVAGVVAGLVGFAAVLALTLFTPSEPEPARP